MFDCCVPSLMGVESLVADELRFGGYQNVRAENGRVLFQGEAEDVARANVGLRCAERVLVRLGSFEADTFDALFEGVRALPLETLIGPGDAFPVKGHSLRSALASVPACQKIIKKAAVERLRAAHGVQTLPETGARRQLQFSLMGNRAEIFIDTTGAPLYRRGYKLEQHEASLRESLAAAIVKLARYKGREALIDPMCGSGTLAIEAAMAALDIAPGARRAFDAERWDAHWQSAFQAAKEKAAAAAERAIAQRAGQPLPITAFDRDEKAVHLAAKSARLAGVDGYITLAQDDARTFAYPESGLVLCNPPYGKRLLDPTAAHALCARLGEALGGRTGLKKYILTSDEDFEAHFGHRATKRRKLYNGMIQCSLYMYYRG